MYVGSPLTPIALNGGKACPEPPSDSSGPCTGFPEYHNVYIEPGSYEIFKQTHEFPEGTIFFKELQLTLSRVMKGNGYEDSRCGTSTIRT